MKNEKLKIKKAGFFDPYLDTLGGGEKYCLTLAEFLLNKGWKVDFFWEGEDLRKKIQERMGININRVNFIPIPKNLLNKLILHQKYDLIFFMGDGSVPFMFGKKNILHFQVPFKKVGGKSFLNRLKFLKINKVICNSWFTKKIVDEEFGIRSEVIYPPVDIEKFSPAKKENLILSVGRFSRLLQAKNQDILIKVFKNLVNRGLRGWRLVLAGGSEVGSGNFVKKLQEMARGYPIEIEKNIPLKKLIDFYARAKIFWSASGYGIDENREPERVEHFGMTTVEAMAAGCVPVVQGKGGQKEIVENSKNGYLWIGKEELIATTLKLIRDNKLLDMISTKAIVRSKEFSKEKFFERIYTLI